MISTSSRIGRVALLLVAAGCQGATAPVVTLTQQTPPAFTAKVASLRYESFFGPGGFWVTQYDLFVAVVPSDSVNAGVVVSVKVPVYLRTGELLTRDTVSDIAPGDSIEVWHDLGVGIGDSESPGPGDSTYGATQVVIDR